MQESSFAVWLRSLRESRGVPLRVVAAAVEMDSTLLSKLEVGDRLPTDEQATAIARHYRVAKDEMRRRLVAARIMHEFGDDPALPHALSIVREETGAASDRLPAQHPVKYRIPRHHNA